MDTMDALNQIAMHLRLKPNMFYYAGTKDRRARTTQWISLKRVNPRTILEAGKRVRGAYVGNFKFSAEPLKLGMLSGNRFTIALRNVQGSDEEIEKAMINLRDGGFINYYGLQRFGSVAAIPTYEIGKALLQSKWDEAIELILKPRAGEQRDMAEAREIYAKTKDASAALKRIYRLDRIEAKLLKGIQMSGPTNPQGALDSIPRNTRLMYIHSYQSYVWNIIVSRRIREYGRKPIAGDIVYEKADTTDEGIEYLTAHEDEESSKDVQEPITKVENETLDVSSKTETVDSDEKMEAEAILEEKDDKVVTDDIKDDSKNEDTKDDEKKTNEADDDEKDNQHALPPVKVLTEADLPNYTLADIVMPQPGFRVIYPSYAQPWYEELLTNDGLNIDLQQKNKKYSLGGAYRKILQVPENLSWKTMHYKEIHDELILCDIDELRGNEGPKDDPSKYTYIYLFNYSTLIIYLSI